ncbi:MAG: type II secretion system protein [Candidatus Saccharimonadaceae bacterium]
MKKGFTIVELIIVILVIAILASIVVVGYNGATKRAVEAGLKSDLKNTAIKLDSARTNQGAFPLILAAADKSESDGSVLTYQSDGLTFCLSGTTKKTGGPTYHIIQGGTVEAGVCP